MTSYSIYDQSGARINQIVASEEFVKSYCTKRGWTYSLSETFVPGLSEDRLQKERLNMLEQSVDFLSDCIAEMATEIYN